MSRELSSIYSDDVLRKGVVIGIKLEGKKDPACLLMLSDEGEQFEAWLAYSALSVEKARHLIVGDEIQMIGLRCDPVMSHRDYNGVRMDEDMRKPIGFFRVTNFSALQRESNSSCQERQRG